MALYSDFFIFLNVFLNYWIGIQYQPILKSKWNDLDSYSGAEKPDQDIANLFSLPLNIYPPESKY